MGRIHIKKLRINIETTLISIYICEGYIDNGGRKGNSWQENRWLGGNGSASGRSQANGKQKKAEIKVYRGWGKDVANGKNIENCKNNI